MFDSTLGIAAVNQVSQLNNFLGANFFGAIEIGLLIFFVMGVINQHFKQKGQVTENAKPTSNRTLLFNHGYDLTRNDVLNFKPRATGKKSLAPKAPRKTRQVNYLSEVRKNASS